jgi:hypothetical protein
MGEVSTSTFHCPTPMRVDSILRYTLCMHPVNMTVLQKCLDTVGRKHPQTTNVKFRIIIYDEDHAGEKAEEERAQPFDLCVYITPHGDELTYIGEKGLVTHLITSPSPLGHEQFDGQSGIVNLLEIIFRYKKKCLSSETQLQLVA